MKKPIKIRRNDPRSLAALVDSVSTGSPCVHYRKTLYCRECFMKHIRATRLAERKRCAKLVAEICYRDHDDGFGSPLKCAGTCREIAYEIRKGL